MPHLLFWSSAAVIAYTYVVFPLLVLARGLIRPVAYRAEAITPTVSLIIAAYNERASIAAKVENSLALDYPPELLEIIVASDGSTDGTDDVVRGLGSPRVKLLSLPRAGKAAALEAAVAAASHEILVFSDANSAYAVDAIRELVRPFADPAVGGVAGNQRYLPDTATPGTAEGERTYWNLDRVLKEAESRAGSTISATGAIYAIRRSLFRGVPVGVTDDFAVSTSVIAQGQRLVFAGDAVAWEAVAPSSGSEWGRKVRVMTRGLRGVYERRELLDPRRHGFYAVQLFSHKVLRRLMAIPLILLAVSAALLWRRGDIYRIATIAQAGFYALGSLGLLLGRRGAARNPALAVPAFFIMVNAAALTAALNVVRGRRIDRWDPIRGSTVSADRDTST